jgi:dipeptidyl-peptidase-4
MKLSIEDLARFPRPGMAVPGKIAFAPDGKSVSFLWSKTGGLDRELWSLDVRGGERSLLLGAEHVGQGATDENVSREEALRRERERLRETGITHYEWAESANVLIAPVRGEVFFRAANGRVTRLAKGALDPHLSKDGSLVCFVRSGELHAVSTATGEERRLTYEAPPGVTNGLAEFVAQEEMHRGRGFWISPDAKLVAYQQVDERGVSIFRIPRWAESDPLAVEEHRYPFAGAANVVWRLGIVPSSGGEPRFLDTAGFEYLARVRWTPQGRLLVQLQSRDQRRLELRSYDPKTLAFETILVEESRSWVNLNDDFRALDSGELLWSSERTGFKHLYLYRGKELLRALTSGDWQVDSVLAATPEVVFLTATRESPLERHVYRVALAGGPVERLTHLPGMHDAVFAKDGSAWVDVHESRAKPPSITVGASSPRTTIHERPAIDLPAPELFEVRSRDGATLHAALYRPTMRAGAIIARPFPLVVSVYGGPHAQMVQDSWGLAVDLRAQYLASRGFAVLKVDNRGSARRGLAFESALHRHMGSVEVRDQVDGVRALVARGDADPGRVGVYGWSYGGYMTLLCLALEPETFRAGVAGAPVTEWEGYDTHYTERYMETPRSNPEGYRESSVLTHVAGISGDLLLVHGMVDENVHFRHTARLVDALVKANKPHDLIAFPNERHMPRSEKDRVALEQRIVGFFEEHLR